MADHTSFQSVLDALQDSKKDFPRAYLKYFSDMDPASLKAFLAVWPQLKADRRLLLLDGLLSLLDSDTLVAFEDVGRALMNDSDSQVRARAIRLLAEANDPKLVNVLIDILKNDTDLPPRIAAANLLGEFVLLGELEELPTDLHGEAEDALMKVAGSEENATLRRASLEAASCSSRPEVETLIQTAFHRTETAWIASALTAMGRSNNDRWGEDVLSMLVNDNVAVRLAAVQAAGELALETARPVILNLLVAGEEDDDDIIAAGIWSLSQIGGEDVRAFLVDMLERTEDDDIAAYIDDALENLDFTEGLEKFDFLSLDDGDEEVDDVGDE